MKITSILAAVAFSVAVASLPAQNFPMAEPKGTLTLSRAIALSLNTGLVLSAERYGLRAGEARSLRARVFPNPELGLEVENLPSSRSSSGADDTETTLRLSHLIELGGKRSARMAEARLANNLAAWDYEIRRLDVLAETARKFIAVVAAQERLALAKEASRLAEAASAAVKERVTAARASVVEQLRADIAVAQARIEAEHAKHSLLSARRALAATWGSEEATFSSARANFYAHRRPETFGSLMARIGSNPDLGRFAEEASLREAQLRIARTRRVPDVTLSAGLRQFASENAWAGVFGVSLPLQHFDRGQADFLEALQLQGKAEAMGKAIRVQLAAKLFETYQELVHAVTELDIMAKEILPAARKVMTATEDGYRQGRFSYLELADARRSLIELQRKNIEAALGYHLQHVEIDRLIGAAALAPQSSLPAPSK
jgi:cobalt-zinc-cadmium efflux system outer membrane protein